MIPSFFNDFPCLFLAKEDHAKTGSAALAVVEAADLIKMAEGFYAAGYYLEDVSGLDTADGAVSVYHFDHFDMTDARVTALALRPHDTPVFPSIASIYQGAEWHERETRDFYGYIYEGNPNLIPLLLPDDMMDVHPLVKEGGRATLLSLFGNEGRPREVVKKADSFTLLDMPEPEPTPEPAPAPEAAAEEAKPAEVAKAEPVAEPAETKPEAPKKPVKKAAPKEGGDDA
ncbi:MAG: NAD(P)H-quinone oxidoreductase subunit J, chloroplastic [Desulfovibrio sp.]